MYISDLILLIIVVLFIFRAALKKRRNAKENNGVQPPDKTGGIRRPLPGTSPVEAPQDACRGIKVLSYYYDSLPFKDGTSSPALPLDAAIEDDVNEALESLCRQGFTPGISYAAVVDRLFIFITY